MNTKNLAAPVVKWVGGKRQLLDAFLPLLPSPRITSYCEPFVGGGALLFKLQPKTAYVNDINPELISMYEVIRDDVEGLILALQEYKNEPSFYYNVRELDRDKDKYNALSPVQKAARIIYLNKTCFNGLFRVNSAGEFNSPFGNYKNPNILNIPTLRGVSAYFNNANIVFSCTDYSKVLEKLNKGTFVYLDPPYDPVSDTANFTGYSRGGFNKEDQIRLRDCCDNLNQRGIKFMLSNSSTAFIRSLYSNYIITTVQARRAINSISERRGEIDELVVRNYE